MKKTCNKVLHIITRFDKGGSAENTFLTVCGLDKGRYEVVLITGRSHPAADDDPEGRAARENMAALKEGGVRVISLPELVRDVRPWSDLVAFFSLYRIIRRERPRIVHTHTSKAGILGRWAAWLGRVPVIVHTPHGHVFWGYFGPWKTRLFALLERWTARITTALVALTPQEKADHLSLGIAPAKEFAVIHSGVDLAKLLDDLSPQAGTKGDLGVPADRPVIATVGRLTAVKNQQILIRAVAALVRKGAKPLLLIGGEGEMREELEALARELGIEGDVRFLGWRKDVARVIDACQVFCLPSLNEGMGKVLVEAMALGKPIIASDIGGIRDLVRHGETGLLVPAADLAAWIEAIASLLADPDRRRKMGEAGRKLAPQYGAEAMIKSIDQLYGKLLNETGH